MLFNSPRLTNDDIAKLYDNNYYIIKRDEAKEYKKIIETYFRTIALLPNDFQAPQTLLEVGCARGYFLALLRELGWQVQGVDISAEATSYAKNRFGINCFQGTLEEYLSKNEERLFSVILSIDLIEHLAEPDNFIRDIGIIIRPGGFLIIDTPNGDAFNIDIDRSNWRGFNPYHIYLFNKENLITLLEKHGFSIKKVFSYNNKYSSSKRYIVYFIRKICSRSIINRSRSIINRLLNYFDKSLTTSIPDIAIKIKNNPMFDHFQSADALGPLAAGWRGDNLVIIAKYQ